MTVISHLPYSPEADPMTSLRFKQTHSTRLPIYIYIFKKRERERRGGVTSQSDVTHGCHWVAISRPQWRLWRGQHWLTRNVVKLEQIHSRNYLITPELQPTPQHALTCTMLVQWQWRTGVGGFGGFKPPPKIVPNSTWLWKLLKIAEFRMLILQDVQKKGSKILKLPLVRNVLH